MKLRFLKQIYTKLQQHPAIPSKNIACYRGHQYNLRVPVAISQSPPPESQMSAVIYKYRGISYVVERHQFPTAKKTLVYR